MNKRKEETPARRFGSLLQHLKPSANDLSTNACISDWQYKDSSFCRKGPPKGPPVIIGAMVLDIHAKPQQKALPGTTTPGQIRYVRGGVGRNVAECMSKLGVDPFIISVVGQDMAGDSLLDHWKSLGLSIDGIRRCPNITTPIVSNVFDVGGELAAAVADVMAVETFLTPEWIIQFRNYIRSAPLIMVDANLHPVALEAACNLAKESDTPVWFEPVSVAKSVRIRSILKYVTFVSPNEAELIAMVEVVSSGGCFNSLKTLEGERRMNIEAIFELFKPAISVLLQEGTQFIVLTLGSHGVLLCSTERSSFRTSSINCSEYSPSTNFKEKGQLGRNKLGASSIQSANMPIFSSTSCVKYQESVHKDLSINCLHFPALPVSIVSLTGAGDCFVGGVLASICAGKDVVNSMAVGVAVAKLAVESEFNVPSHFPTNLLADDVKTILSLTRAIDSSPAERDMV